MTRVGNKGRVCHRWWRRGERAPGTRQIGYQWAYIFSAVRPDTGDDVTLVMPSGQRQGHGPVSRTLRRYPGPGCARRHGPVRRRRLARRARPHRPRQRHLGAVAALLVPNSTPSSGFGSTYANASYRSASSTTPRPSSTPVAKHGSTSSQNRIVCEPSAPIHGSCDFIGSLVLFVIASVACACSVLIIGLKFLSLGISVNMATMFFPFWKAKGLLVALT